MKTLGIFGSSGLAREFADIAHEVGYETIFLIDNFDAVDSVSGLEIISEEKLKQIKHEEIDFLIGVGEANIREKIYRKFLDLNYVNLIHPSVTFGYKQREKLKYKIGNVFCAGSRFTNNIKIGNFCIFNLNVTVGHDCIIEDFVTISPGANISGNVKLSEGCYIGTGSTILQGKSLGTKLIVGKNSIVGAGAVVVKNVAPNTVVKGIPAK
ncbi:acetyltransferase [Bacillus sp. Bva_UNVM-123]|uniref:acetyltransferase n=1 Tax=Bacillus sp. Bva_UNVM-123 TaxID=2829798 RepID=UPI00391F3C75